MSPRPVTPDRPDRLVLWNIDLTLMDVTQVTRAAYVDAFRAVTGRPLVRLPRTAGRTESEIIYEALAANPSSTEPWAPQPRGAADDMLERFMAALAAAFASRRGSLRAQGRLLPGAVEAVAAVAALPGVVQTVFTGSIKPNAIEKLRAFGLEPFFDTAIGGYGSNAYPKGAMLLNTRGLASRKYAASFTEESAVYIADSTRDAEAAQVGGARMAGVASGQSTERELRDAGADAVFADLTDTAAVTAAVDRLTTAVRS